MDSLKRILLILVLCGLALAYLYQHNWSMRLTRRVAELSRQRQSLVEAREQIDVELDQLTSFPRLESLWKSQALRVEVARANRATTNTVVGNTGPASEPAFVAARVTGHRSGQQLVDIGAKPAGGR